MSMETKEMILNTDEMIEETEDNIIDTDMPNVVTEESNTIISIEESINRLCKATELINYIITINSRGKIDETSIKYNEDKESIDDSGNDESIITIGNVDWKVTGKMKHSITNNVIHNLSKLTFSDFDNVYVALKAEAIICDHIIKVDLGERKIISVIPDYDTSSILIQVKALD